MIKKIILGLGGGFVLLIIIAIASGGSSDNIPSPQVVSQVKEVKEETVATATPVTEKVVASVQVKETPKATTSTNTELYSIIKVVDGDTVSVDINGKTETIRLIGLNTPETVDPRKPVECFGKEASNKAKELLAGRKVKVEKDATQGDRDKYGRLLAYITRDDGLFYNKYMIEAGYAYEYTYNLPYKYQAEFKTAQKQAQEAKKGLWAPGACETTTTQPTTPATTQTQTTQTSSQTTTSTGDKDCADFSTQAEAQAYFDSKGGSASNNVDKLDGSDHDGKVCESLP